MRFVAGGALAVLAAWWLVLSFPDMLETFPDALAAVRDETRLDRGDLRRAAFFAVLGVVVAIGLTALGVSVARGSRRAGHIALAAMALLVPLDGTAVARGAGFRTRLYLAIELFVFLTLTIAVMAESSGSRANAAPPGQEHST